MKFRCTLEFESEWGRYLEDHEWMIEHLRIAMNKNDYIWYPKITNLRALPDKRRRKKK
jgi:hypothetical protein